jgi:ACS family hexuronate transporter-like MFS transporter
MQADAAAVKPTNWAPCLAMMGVSLISYIDRSALAILSPTMLAELHLSAAEYGLAISAFSVCYTIGNPVWGYIIDHAGLFWSILTAVAIWTVASGSHALVYGLAGLCLARAVLGCGEGATFPAGLAAVAETLPAEKRSRGLGLSYSGGALGAAITPVIVTPLATAFGWRMAFLVTASAGFLWIAMWVYLSKSGRYTRRRKPSAVDSGAATQQAAWSWRWDRKSRLLIATSVLYGLGALPLAAGLYAAPLYLARELHLSQSSLGHVLWIPPLGWEIGYLAFGTLADKRSVELKNHPGKVFAILAALSLAMAAIPYLHSVAAVMALLIFSMFVAGGFVVLSLSHGLAALNNANPGFLSGCCAAAWSVAVAIVMPVIGRMFDLSRYDVAFWMVAVIPAAGLLLWAVLRPADPALGGSERPA